MSSFQTLFDLIGELARRRYQAAERSFARLGLNHTEARLLALLHQSQGSGSQDELSAMLYVDRSNAGRALQRLEHQGYILRRKDESDKRANLIVITQKGQTAVGEIGKLRRQIVREFFGSLTEAEAAVATELLRKALITQVDPRDPGRG